MIRRAQVRSCTTLLIALLLPFPFFLFSFPISCGSSISNFLVVIIVRVNILGFVFLNCVPAGFTRVCELMYFPLLFQVISRGCFHFTPATSTIVHSVLHGCPDWPAISTYTLRCLLSTIHACGSIQFIHLSGLHSPIRVMPNDQKQSESSSVPAEGG